MNLNVIPTPRVKKGKWSKERLGSFNLFYDLINEGLNCLLLRCIGVLGRVRY